jgi:hypothetical protein
MLVWNPCERASAKTVFTLRPLTAKFALRVSLSCAVALVAVLAWTPARAGDDGDDDAPDVKLLRNLLEGIGLQGPNSKGIDYQERPPLVIPPNSALPPPEAATAVNNPNWPVDPDIKRAKEIRAATRDSGLDSSARMDENSRPLSPDKLNVGQRKKSKRDATGMTYEQSSVPQKPSELGYGGGLFKNMFRKDEPEAGKFTGEPPRASLTDPPAGYQTPSPDQPYGLRREKPKVGNYYKDYGTKDLNH